MQELKTNFLIHWTELKYRVIYYIISFFLSFSICFAFKVELFFLISNIFLNFEHGFIYTGLLDPLLLYLKLSFFFFLVFSFPFFIYFFIFFFFRSFSNFLTIYYFFYIFSLYILVISLFILLVTLIFPVLFEFLLNFQRTNTLETLELILQATINQYYNFFFSYIKIYLLLIFIPNLFFCLILLNFLKKQIFLNFKFRKYLYLIVFLVFLIFAPPDFFLQLLIFPLIIFILEIFIYFISYLLILYYLF